MPDPQTFVGAIIVAIFSGVLLFLIQPIIQNWMNRKRDQAARSVFHGEPAPDLGIGERLFFNLAFARGLRAYSLNYKKKLKERLSKDPGLAYYATLSVLPMTLRLTESIGGRNSEVQDQSVTDAVCHFAKVGLIILGESGGGKSTSMRRVAQMTCDENDHIPLLIELRNYRRGISLMSLMVQEFGNHSWLDRGLRFGRFLLLLDGLNEIDEEIVSDFENELLIFKAEYPNNEVVITCRPKNYRNSFPEFVHMKLQPLNQESIKGFLRLDLGNEKGERLFATLDERLLGFCENPLMLTMLSKTYKTTGQLPPNRAKLYESFLNQFLVLWQDSKRGGNVAVNVKHNLMSDLAFDMANQVVAIELPKAQSIIGRKLNVLRESFPHNYLADDVVDELLSNGLIRLDFGTVSFMHQSVQEYYTALEINERLSAHTLQVSGLDRYVDDARWHETLKMLAGLLSDATELVSVVRKKDLFLASECIYASSYVDPKLVDSAIVQAVTEFKFGSEPFNYPLIFSLKRIGGKKSPNLSQRVIDDMTHWCEKFASSTPRTLVGVSTEDLLATIKEKTNFYLLADAIWTLGVRQEVRAVQPLIDILLDRESKFRADAARALGKIKDKRATRSLLNCIKPEEPKQLRPFIFMALGSIADKDALPELVNYLTDVSNPFRETAAWALLGIADSSLGDFLIRNLYSGIPYARANFVFLLGQLKIEKGLQALIDLMKEEHDPFVREDIAFALGNYGDPRAVPILIDRLNDTDALVRTRVAEALGRIKNREGIQALRGLLTDENQFVRESANNALSRLESIFSEGELANSSSSN